MSTTIERVPKLSSETPVANPWLDFIKRHPVASYFATVLLISWSGVALVVALGPGRFPVTMTEFEPYIWSWGLALVAGPTSAGLLLTRLTGGRGAVRRLLSRLTKLRLAARWYAVALLAAPVTMLAVLLPLSLVSEDFLPAIVTTDERGALLAMGIGAGLFAGVFEELGWTGFAVPELRKRYGILATALLLGVVWALWHIPAYAVENGTPSGTLSLRVFLPNVLFFLGVLTVFRVVLVWFYDRTESLPLTMIMHASLSATAPFILAPDVTGARLAGFYLAWAALLWIVVAAVAVRHPLPTSSSTAPRKLNYVRKGVSR
jgi:hypothetical protein